MCKSTFVVLLALLTLSTSQTAFSQQNNDCLWHFLAELAKDPNYNSFADIPLTYSREYMPPHTRGDRDFKGHGPNVWASLSFQVQPNGIFANVWMKAEETKKDWTTAEERETLWFLHLKNGWVIQQVAEQGYPGDGRVVPQNVLPVPSSSFLNFSYRDHNHDIDTINVQDKLVSSVQFVGDTRGNEAGTRTKIIVGSKIGAVCLAHLSN